MSILFQYVAGMAFDDLFTDVANHVLNKCRVEEMESHGTFLKNFYHEKKLVASLIGLLDDETFTNYGRQLVLQELAERIKNISSRIAIETEQTT